MKVMVVGVGRVMELDEGLSGEQGVMVVDRENGGFVMEQVDLCGLRATSGDSKGRVWMVCSFLILVMDVVGVHIGAA